jgi:hypothetical protein
MMNMRFAFRSLFRSPAYAATSIGTIALASTIFAIVDGVLFKPLPYREAHQLFSISGSSREAESPTAVLSWADVTYLRDSARVGCNLTVARIRQVPGTLNPLN